MVVKACQGASITRASLCERHGSDKRGAPTFSAWFRELAARSLRAFWLESELTQADLARFLGKRVNLVALWLKAASLSPRAVLRLSVMEVIDLEGAPNLELARSLRPLAGAL